MLTRLSVASKLGPMQTVNRMAAVVTPQEPFFEWSHSVLGEDSNQCGPDEFRTEYLVPERDEIDRSLRTVFGDIFDEMLLASVNVTT